MSNAITTHVIPRSRRIAWSSPIQRLGPFDNFEYVHGGINLNTRVFNLTAAPIVVFINGRRHTVEPIPSYDYKSNTYFRELEEGVYICTASTNTEYNLVNDLAVERERLHKKVGARGSHATDDDVVTIEGLYKRIRPVAGSFTPDNIDARTSYETFHVNTRMLHLADRVWLRDLNITISTKVDCPNMCDYRPLESIPDSENPVSTNDIDTATQVGVKIYQNTARDNPTTYFINVLGSVVAVKSEYHPIKNHVVINHPAASDEYVDPNEPNCSLTQMTIEDALSRNFIYHTYEQAKMLGGEEAVGKHKRELEMLKNKERVEREKHERELEALAARNKTVEQSARVKEQMEQSAFTRKMAYETQSATTRNTKDSIGLIGAIVGFAATIVGLFFKFRTK